METTFTPIAANIAATHPEANHRHQEPTSIFKEMIKANDSELHLMGGKAATLAQLLKKGFPVPQGAVVFHEPKSNDDLAELLLWWKKQGSYPVAARSSASGEDSVDFSYAGQFVTLLHLATADDLANGIKTCFQAVHRTASKAYASHFDRAEIPMHVLVQRMIDSQYSGVYFSIDPRREDAAWLVEVVEGQGEQLVSGQVTPFRFDADNKTPGLLPNNWKKEYLEKIILWGQEVEKFFGYKVDMEWAIDQEGQFWILQSRPITAHAAPSSKRKVLDQEWKRILKEYSSESIWDGHTFAEWTGIPTEVTFDLWQKTFQPGQAFDLALKSIGYEGLDSNSNESLLDRIYGRAYLNLKTMEPVYFGRSPYRLNPFPRPHLEFDWSKLTPEMILRAPAGLGKMAHVAWNIQTSRSDLAKKALARVKDQNTAQSTSAIELRAQIQNLSWTEALAQLKQLSITFTHDSLQGTFLITLLIEATTQGLLALLEKDLGAEKSAEAVHVLTGLGLQTVATEMYHELSKVDSAEKWQVYLAHFGHRGVGELELSHPRWVETQQPQSKKVFKAQLNHDFKEFEVSLESQFENHTVLKEMSSQLSSIRKPVFKQEWIELQKLMQIREKIKMELMKPYAQIRWVLQNISDKSGLGNQIFWLRLEEIYNLQNAQAPESLVNLAQERKQNALQVL